MVNIEKDIVQKFDYLNVATHKDDFISLPYEAQCLYLHLVLNADKDMCVWRANALSRMLFGDDVDIDTEKPLDTLIEAGFVTDTYDELGNFGYELIQR